MFKLFQNGKCALKSLKMKTNLLKGDKKLCPFFVENIHGILKLIQPVVAWKSKNGERITK